MNLMTNPSKTSVFYLCFLFALVYGKRKFTEEELELAKNSGIDPNTISDDAVFITPAKLSDEERGSKFMPAAYKCDGCHAIAYQLKKAFLAAEKKKKAGDLLDEAEVLEVFENVCEGEFENYGLKNVQGQKVLSGEGLLGEKLSGMVEAGGIWQKRFQNICHEVSGEYEEENIYQWFTLRGSPFKQLLCRNYCEYNKDSIMVSSKDEL